MSRREEISFGIIDFDTVYKVSNAPPATGRKGAVIYVTDGNAGAACLALSDGTNWKICATLGATIHNP